MNRISGFHELYPLHLSTYLPIYLFTYLPIYLYTYIPIYLYTYIPIFLKRQLLRRAACTQGLALGGDRTRDEVCQFGKRLRIGLSYLYILSKTGFILEVLQVSAYPGILD